MLLIKDRIKYSMVKLASKDTRHYALNLEIVFMIGLFYHVTTTIFCCAPFGAQYLWLLLSLCDVSCPSFIEMKTKH